MTTYQDPAGLRASDRDRDLAMQDLRAACEWGRLATEEFASRAHRAMTAPTLGDLWRITDDIPHTNPAGPPALQAPPVGPPLWGPAYPVLPPPYVPAPQWDYTGPVQQRKPPVSAMALVAFTMSVVGLILSTLFFASIVAGMLGLAAQRQTRRDPDDRAGHYLSAAAIALALSSIAIGIAVVVGFRS